MKRDAQTVLLKQKMFIDSAAFLCVLYCFISSKLPSSLRLWLWDLSIVFNMHQILLKVMLILFSAVFCWWVLWCLQLVNSLRSFWNSEDVQNKTHMQMWRPHCLCVCFITAFPTEGSTELKFGLAAADAQPWTNVHTSDVNSEQTWLRPDRWAHFSATVTLESMQRKCKFIQLDGGTMLHNALAL